MKAILLKGSSIEEYIDYRRDYPDEGIPMDSLEKRNGKFYIVPADESEIEAICRSLDYDLLNPINDSDYEVVEL